jgi:predicted ferric reductase
MRLKKWFYLLCAIHVLLTSYFWFETSGSQLLHSDTDIYLGLGRLSGLLLVDVILLQVMLMGRARWLESVFGLDKLATVHRFAGKWITILLLAHPILLTLAYQNFTGAGFLSQLWDFQVSFEDVWHASIGFAFFLFVIVYSILMSRRKWDFERWYWAHLSVYAAIILAFGHQTAVGGDFLGSSPIFNNIPELTWFTLYWYIVHAFVFGNLVWYRICRPLWNYYLHGFTVSTIKNETPDVWSLYITGKNIQNFSYTPGQFVIIRFLAKGYYWQAHPFSLSCYPNTEHIRLSIKASGDFTKTIGRLPIGTKAYIEGPYGTLTAKKSQTNKVLMIAGGIGITPFRGIIEDLGKAGKDIHLIYGNKTEADIALRTELEELAQKYNINIHHVLSNVEANSLQLTANSFESFSSGFVTPELIQQLVSDVASREAFLCGPPPMMDALVKTLTGLGIKKNNIYFEKFAL